MFTGARNTEPLAGLMILTTGGRLVGGGGGGPSRTLMFTGSDVAEAPRVSLAKAVRTQSPGGTLDQTRQNGLRGPAQVGQSVRTPRLFVPAKNSTVVTKPSVSRASAQMPMLTGVRKVAPFVGVEMRTVGGMLVVLLP